jgi:hypothetical protein
VNAPLLRLYHTLFSSNIIHPGLLSAKDANQKANYFDKVLLLGSIWRVKNSIERLH